MITDWNLKVSSATFGTSSSAILTELTLPNIEVEFNTDRLISYPGVVPMPTGFGEMTIEFSGRHNPNDLIFNQIMLSRTQKNFIFTGAEIKPDDTFNNHIIVCKGWSQTVPLGSFSAGDPAEFAYTGRINYVDWKINNQPFFKFDVVNYIYEVNGINELAQIKSILGQ